MYILRSLATLTALILLPCVVYAQAPTTTATEPSPQYGWLEGTVTTNQGHPVEEVYLSGSKEIKLVRHGGGAYTIQSDANLGGFYSNHELKPGVYDISVTSGYYRYTGTAVPYRPQRILGVLIKPGQRTVLNIVMPPGDVLQETSVSAGVSVQVNTVAAEIAQQQKQIDDLKQQVAALKASLTATAKP